MSKYKYAGILPDLDDAPDVYETPDQPYEPTYEHDSNSEDELGGPAEQAKPLDGNVNNNIDKSKTDVDNARDKFRDAKYSRSSIDRYSRSSRKLPPGYLPESVSYSVKPRQRRKYIGPNGDRLEGYNDDEQEEEEETLTERLRRLRLEVEEMEEELEKKKKEEAKNKQNENDSFEQVQDQDAQQQEQEKQGKHKASKEKDVTSALLSQIRYIRNNLSQLSGPVSSASEKENLQVQSVDRARLQELINGLNNATDNSDEQSKGQEVEQEEQQDGAANNNTKKSAPQQLLRESHIAQLDSRLVKLEKFIGANEADINETHPLPAPLLTTLAKIEHQLHLLTQPRHLDSISRRVKLLVSDLERVHESRRKLGDTRPLNISLSNGITVVAPGKSSGPGSGSGEAGNSASAGGAGGNAITSTLGSNNNDDTNNLSGSSVSRLPPDTAQQVESIFAALPRIETLGPVVPQLVMRLRSLASLHGAAGSFSDDLANVQREAARLDASEKRITEAISKLEESMTANAQTMQANMTSLAARLEALQEQK